MAARLAVFREAPTTELPGRAVCSPRVTEPRRSSGVLQMTLRGMLGEREQLRPETSTRAQRWRLQGAGSTPRSAVHSTGNQSAACGAFIPAITAKASGGAYVAAQSREGHGLLAHADPAGWAAQGALGEGSGTAASVPAVGAWRAPRPLATVGARGLLQGRPGPEPGDGEDGGPGDGEDGGPGDGYDVVVNITAYAGGQSAWSQLAEAIMDDAVHTINLLSSAQYNSDEEALPKIMRPLAILGACQDGSEGECTLDGAAAAEGGLVVETSGEVRLRHLALRNMSGQGLLVDGGGSAHLHSCRVMHCRARNGAGIAVGIGSTVTLDGASEVSWNVAEKSGGGIYVEGGSGSGSVILTGSAVRQNSAGGMGALRGRGPCFRGGGSVVAGNTARGGGGIFGENGAHIEVAGSFVMGNAAAEGGGGVSGSNVTIRGASRVASNSAEQGGGVLGASAGGHIVVNNSTLTGNSASKAGGGAYGAWIHVANQSKVVNNTALGGSGGGVYLLSVADSEEAGLTVSTGTDLSSNHASRHGGAVHTEPNATVKLHDAIVSGNRADAAGGALYLSAGAHLEANRMEFLRNVAVGSGGGVYLEGRAGTAWIHASLFEGNEAGISAGAVYLGEASSQADISLERLQLLGNRAQPAAGQHLLWHYLPHDHLPPSCAGCRASPEGTAVLASTPVVGVVMQNASSADAGEPGATANSLYHPRSGQIINPPLMYQLLDWYGNRSNIAGDSAEAQCPLTVAAVGGDGATLAGGTLVQYDIGTGVAEFAQVRMRGNPGDTFTVSFELSSDWLSDTAAELRVAPCKVGDELNNYTLECVRCRAGYLSFSSEYEEGTGCVSCGEVEGLECLGGSQFEVQQGFWLSPRAALAGTDTCEGPDGEPTHGDDLCIFKYVYKCDTVTACTSAEAGRSGELASDALTMQLCGDGHDPGVVQCGSCEEGFEITPTDECVRCPKAGASTAFWIQAVAICALTIFVLWMWYPISLRFGKVFTALQGDAKTLVEGMDDCMSLASQITSTLVQYVQTVAPTLTLFEDQITGSLRAFSNHLSVIELPVGELLRVQCLTFNLSVSSSVKIYYLGLYFKLLLPPVILTVGAVLLRSYNRRIRSLAKRVGKARRGLHQARVQKDNLETLCIFLLQFLYPSVTMACCELFLCDEVLSSENLGESQSWLRQDRTIQCYAGSWWIAMGLCLVTAGYYVFGMPIGLFLMLRHLHRHKLYEVIEDGELKEINTAIAHVLPRAILGAAFTEKYRKGEEEEEEKPDDGEIDDGGDVAFDD
ncbi:hypothetical protein CYMTET_50349 [Cymbomonas tetramitiformis]|uniref:Right handed beta helix domain-containing protein n=1 Tax=Cymbomonas tetramitiformis TaxID=36881 RepID=A0AAE0BPY7_9CHLO|nr:hypothetical protein CYMTET_50349 [Cymbomonas tetramitiformis]